MKKIIVAAIVVLTLTAAVTGSRLLWPTFAAAGWKQDAGPLGGTVTRMVTVNGKIWAALYSGGIYELSGSTWSQIGIFRGLPENRTFDIVQDPVNTQNLYVGQMIACAAKTADAGGSWSGLCDAMLVAADAPNFSSHTLALDPTDPSTVYVVGHTHDQTSMLLVSDDGGGTWEKVFTFAQHMDFTHLVFFNGVMYLSTEADGVFVSSDRGQTWTPFTVGLAAGPNGRFLVFKNRLYLEGGMFLKFNTRTGGSLYRLDASASGWEQMVGPKRVTGTGTDGATLWVGGQESQVWKSADGVTFTKIPAKGLPPAWIGEMVVQGSTLSFGMGGFGVYRSTNGGLTFKEFNRGMKAIATREVRVNPKNANQLYVVTWDRLGMSYSKDGGMSFRLFGPDANILTLAPDPKDFNHFYAAGDRFQEGRLSSSKTKVTWVTRKKPGPRSSVVKSLAVHPKKSNILLAGVATETAELPTGYGLYFSKNAGRSWKKASGIPNQAVYSIHFDPKNPAIVFASALGAGVFQSTNGGTSFMQIGGEQLQYTYRIAMDPKNSRHLLASSNTFFGGLTPEEQISGLYGGLFETMDAGATWTDITKGIRDYDGTDDPAGFQGWMYNLGHLPNYEEILIDPNDAKHITVGHHGESVVVTTDGGQTWEKQTAGMIPGSMHNYAYCLGQSKNGSKVYACTCGRGLFSGNVSRTTGQVVWQPTLLGVPVAYAANDDDFPDPKNAEQARAFILGGEDNHQH